MQLAIIQPNFIPWRGYYDVIDDVDCFVFYDDVKLGTGKKWRNRNLIKTPTGTRWLTVPLVSGQGEQLLHNVRIDYSRNWRGRHLNVLFANYGKAPFWDMYIDELAAILRCKYIFLMDLNIQLCEWIMALLEINTPTVRSKDLGVAFNDKHNRPLEILESLGATQYLSGPTAADYTDSSLYEEKSIRLQFKTYGYPEYPQQWGEFDGRVSIIDMLFNVGPAARNFLKSKLPNLVIVE